MSDFLGGLVANGFIFGYVIGIFLIGLFTMPIRLIQLLFGL
jgi:hypothetical protein